MTSMRSSMARALVLALISAPVHMAGAMPQGAPAPASQKPTAPAVSMDSPKIALVDPGAEPRRPMRYKIQQGAKFNAEMIMKMDMSMSMGEMKLPSVKTPSMKMVMQCTVTDVQANGDIAYDCVFSEMDTIDEPGVQPQTAAMLKAQLKTMVGMNAHAVVTDRGLTKEVEFKIPAGAPDAVKQQIESMKQSLNQMCLPLPEEPIGAGAKWNVESQITSGGIAIAQLINATLSTIDGDTLAIGMEMSQTAQPQNVAAPGMPAGVKIQLNSFSGNGQGKSAINLSQIMPDKAETKMAGDLAMTVNSNGPPQEMAQHIEMTMNLKCVSASASSSQSPAKPAVSP